VNRLIPATTSAIDIGKQTNNECIDLVSPNYTPVIKLIPATTSAIDIGKQTNNECVDLACPNYLFESA
jgi:hypothetical protein